MPSQKEKDAREFEKAIDDARKVRETMKTEGWKIVHKIIVESIRALDTVKDVTTVKELQARQLAIRTLTRFVNSLTDIVDRIDEVEKQVLPNEEQILKLMKDKS